MKRIVLFLIFLLFNVCIQSSVECNSQNKENKNSSLIKLARVKYSGGGDWYTDPSSEINLLNYVKSNTNIPVAPVYEYVDLASDELFTYPILFITGHGNMNLSEREVVNLREYLDNGGFLYVDDDYGLDQFIRREMKKVFPDEKFIELPFSHGLFHIHYNFPNGVPKIHEHDGKAPQTFGLFRNNRLCVVYTYESNPSDGWADKEVHDNPEEKRELAMQFGVNIIVWALNN
ncbi:MAG: DUF4159 domain-containing protein [Bacteroidetes bacterium]|nr:DUF4159 domain-containing protein [Bacteroidota bacterium]